MAKMFNNKNMQGIDELSNNKRIAKNMLMLYFRMFLLLFLNIYTSRIVLKALGIDDFGIYNVVAGFVFLFQIFISAVTVAISRFLTIELGKTANELTRLRKVFATSLATQILMSFILLILFETIGLWLLNNKLVIMPERLFAANIAFQVSVASFILIILSSPFNSLIVSHEKMSAFSYITVLDGFLKLLVAFVTLWCTTDKLITYSIFMASISIIGVFIRLIYCIRKFPECNLTPQYDMKLFKEILGFAGWTYIRSATGVLQDQGGNVLINLFFGPKVNAARGLAVQVRSASYSFVTNYMLALNPQITKNYAADNYLYTSKLVNVGSRFSFYILFLVCMPIFFNADYILSIWLYEVPTHTSAFIRIIIIDILCMSLYESLNTLIWASGKIKTYHLLMAMIRIIGLCMAYVLFKIGFPPESIFVINVFVELGCLLSALYTINKFTNMSATDYFHTVIIKISKVVLVSSAFPLLFYLYSHHDRLLDFVFSCIICLLSVGIVVLYLGCDSGERTFVITKVKQKLFACKY